MAGPRQSPARAGPSYVEKGRYVVPPISIAGFSLRAGNFIAFESRSSHACRTSEESPAAAHPPRRDGDGREPDQEVGLPRLCGRAIRDPGRLELKLG